MPPTPALERPHRPDPDGLVDNILRKGTPARPHHIELFHDGEIERAIAKRFGLRQSAPGDQDGQWRQHVAVYRFLGFDYVNVRPLGPAWQFHNAVADDTAALKRDGGRGFRDEHRGPITGWADFERYPWPDPTGPEVTRPLEWFQRNVPDDMCLITPSQGHFAEHLTWLMGYESLCYALYEHRDLVAAIAAKLEEYFTAMLACVLRFDRVRLVFGSDDMGFKTGLMFSPDDMREFVLPGHRKLAAMCHEARRPYLLHACGNLADIMDDLIDDVGIDGKHSFEDTIEDVREVKRTYGQRVALLGGIDVDFLCRADEEAIRRRVRETLEVCLPGGGYCLGTGNSVANYIPLDNYLAMVDEAWACAG